MQRFREPTETTTPAASVYDSETVREVLARAAQIEAERQADAPMNAEQIETLGQELGLSPDAVRQSLGEKVGTVAPSTVAMHTVALPPITRANVIRAVINAFVYSSLATAVVIGYIALTSHNYHFVPSPWLTTLGILTVVLTVLLSWFGAFLIPFLYAWRHKDWRQGMLLGAAIIPLYALGLGIACMMADSSSRSNFYSWGFLWSIAPFAPIAGAIGGIAGRWWDKLPKDAANR